MCGKKNFKQLWNSTKTNYGNLHMTYADQEYFQKRLEKGIDPLGVSQMLGFTGGRDSLADITGLRKHRRKEEKAVEAKELALQKMQYSPFAPEKTAMLLEPNAQLRDSRRRAALLGMQQLRSPGVGSGSGSNYSGANAASY